MLDLLHQLIFSFISGLSEFLFVSGSAHQFLYMTITGIDQPGSLIALTVHLGWFAALLVNCGAKLKELRYERRLAMVTQRRRTRHPNPGALMDMRIINTAAVPILLSLLFAGYLPEWSNKQGVIALFLFINGVLLFLPSLFRSGNKDSLSYTMLDGLLMGLSAVLGILPGISRLGCMFGVGCLRGADKKYSLELSLLTLVPVTLGLLCLDIYTLVSLGTGLNGIRFIGCVLSFLGSFAGAYLSVSLLHYICDRTNTNGFAYYSCGLAVFQFLLYLIIP